ncbi:conserved hypothetical protein [Leishmania major strain Friedlin]|uniref:Uncharacterized protein n=1 Tax=Leishmania major TaxID=5664 RepID=Q4QFD2_LEIMA|nr:conserved hypothetical protein [Leishmania major strain Friedlin]CAG9571399.1 hypothetical_protein_-_conserved [Leishmania major strain Friedlin]CAJ03277.1 conserved hypothetical protein [Leishmania major strain Friedlin]|eukprot:XP_001681966.1 conserved hypothetical protein [Leishmania major strain Friedlin]
MDGSPTDVMDGAENLAAVTAAESAANVRDKSADHGQGCDDAVVEPIPAKSFSSRPSSTPATRTAPRTDRVGSLDDDKRQQVEAWSANSQSHHGSLISASVKKDRSGGVCADNGNGGAEVRQGQQLRSPLITFTESSSDIMDATDVLRHRHVQHTAAPPSCIAPSAPSSPTCGSPPLVPTAATEHRPQQQQQHIDHTVLRSALDVVLPRALTQRAPSLQRGAMNPPLSPSSSRPSVPAVAHSDLLSKSTSQPETQHTRSSSPSLRSPTPLDLTGPPKRRPARRSDMVESTEAMGKVEDPSEGDNMERRGNGSAAPPKSDQSQQLCAAKSCQWTQQRPRRLSFSGSSAAATEDHFATASQAEAGALDKICVAPSPSAPPPAVHYSAANASGVQAEAQETIAASGGSKPERISTPRADYTLASRVSVKVSHTSLKPEAAVVAQQQRLSSSPSRHLSYGLFPSPEPLRHLGSPMRLRERQRPSSHPLVGADGHALPAPVFLPDTPATATRAASCAGTSATVMPLSGRHVARSTQNLQRQLSSAVRQSIRGADGSGAGSADGAPPCVPQVIPTHDSVFFPMGTGVIAPVVLHYLTVAGWSTKAGGRDYFSHRRLRGGEVAGHTVRWLHTAKPRDQFVFLVAPVIHRNEAAAEQRRRCTPSSIAGASPPASGSEGGGATGPALDVPSSGSSTKAHMTWSGKPRATTTTTRWEWNAPAKRLQELRARVFGEAPWFTYSTKKVCACSLIAQVNDDGALSISGAATPSGDSLSDPSKDDGDDEDEAADSASGSRSCSDDAFRRSPRMRRSTQSLSPSLPGAQMSGVSGGGLRKGISPHSMSPAHLARQSSQSPPASVASAASSPTSSSSLFVGLALSSPGVQRATTQNVLPAIVPARSATPVELRRTSSSAGGGSGIYSSYVWSPATGTATAASVASPVTPRQPLQSLVPAAAAASSSAAANTAPASVGVEVVVVAHADVTAMDYAPRLTSQRLSIEAKAAHTYFFPLLSDALAYYQCEDAMGLMEEQWSAAVTSQIPRPRAAAPRSQRQQRPRRQPSHLSAAGFGSGCRNASVRTAPLSSLGAPLLHQDGDSPNLVSSTSREPPKTRADAHRCREGDCCEAQTPCPGTSTADSAPRALWGSEAGSDRTATGMSLSGTPLRLYRNQQPPHHTHTLMHPATLPPSQSLSLSDALRSAQGMGSVSCSGSHGGGRLGLSSITTFRPPTLLPRAAATARVTPPSAPAAPRLVPPSQPQPCCLSPAQPHLTSSHGEIVVSVYTADPVFNTVLRELLVPEPGTHPYTVSVAEQKRLLSMVEVGMPAWCVFYSSTGLPYRRLFRLLYSGLTNLWPLLSLAVGLYDLYKHLPQLKRFMEHTLEPITRWMEQRFTIRVSVLVTYLISVVVTICSSLSSFVSQFYVVQLFSLPIVQLVLALLKLPFVIAFDTVWTLATTVLGTVGLVLQVVRMVIMAPFVLVTNFASLRDTFGAAVPMAVEGTSVSVKQWRAWVEFWQTVASPMKNAARAWWDSMMHVSTSAARREMSIRRWTSPKLEQLAMMVGEVQDCLIINAQLWWTYILLPGIERKVLLSVMLVYLYWLFLGISPELWDEVIYASGVRHHPSLRRGPSASPTATVTSAIQKETPAPSSPFPVAPPANSHADAQYKAGSIGTCDGDRYVSVSTTSVGGQWSLYAYFHNLLRDAGSHASPSSSSAGTQPSSAVSAEKCSSASGVSGVRSITLRPETQQTFSALVAELLLPNMVLELLHHVRSALALGWSRGVAVALRMAAGHVQVPQRDCTGETCNTGSIDSTTPFQCSCADSLDAAFGKKSHTTADAAAA